MKGRAVVLGAFGAFFLFLMLHAPGLDFYLSSPDHGHQLSLGRQVLLGKFPFIDLFFKYGPLTAVTSALGIWAWDCLIPETILCAAGYAVTLAIVFCLIRHYTSSITAAVGSLAGLALLARFYKWYYWLFPVLVLYCAHRWLQAKEDGQIRWVFAGGVAGGVGSLFRFDLGLACGCFSVLLLPILSIQPFHSRQLIRCAAISLLGWLLPMGLWLIMLSYHGGIAAVPDYFLATYSGAKGSLEGMALPIPRFDGGDLWSAESRAALAFLLLPCTYIAAIVYGIAHGRKAGTRDAARYRFLVGVGLMGLGGFPQAMHRADLLHLLQVLPPMLVAASFLVWDAIQRSRLPFHGWWHQRVLMTATGAFLVALPVTFLTMLPYGGFDLESTRQGVVKRYQGLVRGCQEAKKNPICEIVSAMTQNTSSHDPVLVADAACQVNYFSRRPLSGILIGFEPAYFDGDRWRIRELEAVESNPPALVMAPEGFLKYGPRHWFRVAYPELYDFLAGNYREEVKKAGPYVLLVRSNRRVAWVSDSEQMSCTNYPESCEK